MASTGVQPRAENRNASRLWANTPVRNILLGALLAIVTFCLYAPVHTHPFFSLDDRFYVIDNPHVNHGLTWDTIHWSFTTVDRVNWIPLTWASHALDCQMFGLDPAGPHDVNLVLHILNALLLFGVLYQATGFIGRSWMVAALFALHPINVESVAWIAERKNLLSMLFFLLALGAYRWYARNPEDNKRYTVVALLFALGLLSKPQVITLPFVLLLWDYWPLQRMFPDAPSSAPPLDAFPRRTFSSLIKEKLPLLYLCIVDVLFTMHGQSTARLGLMPPLSARLKNAVFSYVIYIKQMFWPTGMAPELPHRGASLAAWQVLGSVAILIAITVLALAARKYRYLPVGWFWFLGILVPMIGIVQVGHQGMADRYAYVPMVGLFLMVCWGVSDWASRRRVSVAWLAAASMVALVALTTVTHRQLGYWKDNLVLWRHAAEAVPNHWAAETNVGTLLLEHGKEGEAMPHFLRAVEINPDAGISNMYVAYYEENQGNHKEAIDHYQHALNDFDVTPELRAHAWHNMGVAYQELGDTAKAQECFATAATYPKQK